MTSVSSVGTISSAGIGSGLDVNSIVTQLMAVESQPLTMLQQKDTGLNTEVSSFGQLQSLTSTMRDAAETLSSVALWNQTVASSSDTSAVTVSTSDTGAAAGSYSVSVQNLAAGQTVSSRAFATSSSTLDAGTLTIQLGNWSGEPSPTGFTSKSGSTAITIPIDSSSTSLASIRDKINAANAGVTATIVTDASGARLALRSSDTGAENGFRITATETTDDGDPTSGLSALAFDAAGGTSQMSRNQTAANANATINGIAITSASNTLTGVADGLTLNLLKTTTASTPVGVSVAADTTSITGDVNNFVKAYNALNAYIHDQTKYDPTSKTGGPLQGDRTVGSLLTQMRGVFNQDSSASSVFGNLSEVGITMLADGSMAVDSTKLNAGIANLPELRKLFAADGSTPAASGFMTRFRQLGDAELDSSNGAIITRTKSLQSMLADNAKNEASMQTRLDQTQARLLKQYQALDATMAQMSSLSNYMTNQLAMLAKSTA